MEVANKKVLLIRLSALGDVIFNIPLANVLKKAGAKLHFLVSEKGYLLIKDNPCADRAILVPIEKWKKQKNKLKNFFEYLKLILALRREKYDIVIDTQLILKSLVWTLFSGGKRRIVSKSAREGAILGGNEVIEPLFKDFKLHAVYNYYKFAKYLGLDTSCVEITLPEIPARCDLLKNIDLSKKNLMIAPGTTWKNKHWNKENWKELVLKIDKTKYNLIFLGTKKEIELIEYIGGANHLNLAGKTDLLELAGVLKTADILISLDSGTTHLGWAVQKPAIISIFCSTPKQRYAPLGIKHIALSGNLNCQPCHKKKCPYKTNNCTKYPSVQEVLDALNEINKSLDNDKIAANNKQEV